MLIKNWNDWYEKGHVGDWCFKTEQKTGQLNIYIRYPAKDAGDLPIEIKKGNVVRIPLNQPEGVLEKPWQWDGNRKAPTITPSILVRFASGGEDQTWHGYLTAGKLITV